MRSSSLPSVCSSRQTVHRVSLACMQCRSRHMRCDAKQPECSRCQLDKRRCTYVKSKRGGRRRATSADSPQGESTVFSEPTSVSPEWKKYIDTIREPSQEIVFSEPCSVTSDSQATPSMIDDPVASPFDNLLDLYYSTFHAAHAFVLPKQNLLDRLEKDPLSFEALVLVMRYIGSLFNPSTSSASLERKVQRALAPIRSREYFLTGYHVQCLLLYSCAAYWCNKTETGLRLLDETIQLAIELGMELESYAIQHGEGDPVLEESWRRTWWQIYVTEAHITGTTRSFPTKTGGLHITTALPCEDHNYQSGTIPPPRTLYEYDMREFLMAEGDAEFSSIAELIGLTRTLNMVLSGRKTGNLSVTRTICAEVDIAISAWCALLPASKKNVKRSDGTVDEQLFNANILIHTCIVDLHRELSDLAYSPIESVSRCAPPSPAERLHVFPSNETHGHTLRVLSSIEKVGRLLNVVTAFDTCTPFLISMIANTTVAHLSACKHLFRGRRLQMEREKIRLSMAALKSLSEFWPLGRRTYTELGIIARESLSLADREISPWVASMGLPPVMCRNIGADLGGALDTCNPFDDSASCEFLMNV
ncbi:C6 transcription factor [Coccidioides immitis RS]|uniref:C6 transcription factor n=3 Tax=Coccidioides immitis TaxID=5501 RepID=A0A0E1S4T2_COCIM|nr:C6 transcription factor [Coccidioides immitis RS]EAS35802.2 C6 transcription factor [Coccidioides immitis RS]KMP01087.1 hypothetical protein CIRG_01227 [Coccidioides immitis RMSCC 2394]KMU74332.1 hypothetical protein CISG_04681 [Coccidioides immitis RMSCC 3703]